jgi:hypothetical protein
MRYAILISVFAVFALGGVRAHAQCLPSAPLGQFDVIA